MPGGSSTGWHRWPEAGVEEAWVQVQILGPLAIILRGEPIRLGPPVQRRVLAALLLRRNEIVPRRVLISEVWPADADVFAAWELEERKRGALFTYIARLRTILEPVARIVGQDAVLHTEDNGYRLVLEDKYVDETEFTNLVRNGHDELEAGRVAVALQRFDLALALWRGRPLGELHTEEFAEATVARLESVRLGALEARADAYLTLGRHRDLFAEPGLRSWVEQYPASERLHRAYVVTLHRCGQTPAALAACQDGVAHLTRLGVTPSGLHDLAVELAGSVASSDGVPMLDPRPPSAAHAKNADCPDPAVEVLGRLVRRQWQAEIALRRLSDPHPMPVRWLLRSPGAGEHTLRTDDMPAFATAFQALQRPRLVMLGPAGSGKTTAAILLAVELTVRRQPHEPVPILLSLSSWQPDREHLHTWLRTRLAEHHPALLDTTRFGATAIADLVSDRRILPILDGLDEVPGPRRSAMMRAINRTLLPSDSIVLTSRPTEYLAVASGEEGLSGATILEAQPLGSSEAFAYLLHSAGLQHRAPSWEPVLAALAARADGPVATALTSPLLVMLARLVYAGSREPAELLDDDRFPDLAAIEGHLLDALVPALLEMDIHREARVGLRGHDAGAFQHRLVFLARHAHRQETYDLAWWQLSDAVRPLAGRVSRAMSVALLVTVIAVVVVLAKDLPEYAATIGLLAGLEHTLTQGLRHSLAFGLGTLAATLSAGGVTPVGGAEPGRWWRIPVSALRTGAAGGGVLGLVEGIGAACGGEPAASAAITGIAYGMGLSVAFGLTAVIAAVPSPTATDLRLRGRVGSLFRTLGGGLAAGAIIGLAIGLAEEFVLAVADSAGATYDADLVFGLLPGLVFGLVVGPASALVHWSRRPIVVEAARDLRSTLAVDRRQYLTLVAAVTATIMLAFTLGAAVLPGQTLADALGRGVGAGLGGGVVLALAFGFISAWPRYQLARAWLALRRKVPWRLASFLEEAHRIGVMRRLGATYQFRHARLQDRLALRGTRGAAARR